MRLNAYRLTELSAKYARTVGKGKVINMQSLEIISVNLWHILISLANLAIIFYFVKRFLFKPVQKLMDDRKAEIEHQYAAADAAVKQANSEKAEWEKKMQAAGEEADSILRDAQDTAKFRAEQIIDEANSKAEGIVRRAENEALLTRQKAEEGIRHEIVDVSAQIAEKLIERELSSDDHRNIINSFIDGIGEDNDGDK